jgi:hypothetical protein
MDDLLNKKYFSKRVENLVTDKPMPYMDAIIMCSVALGLEIEIAAKLVNKNIKEKLEAEAQDLNLMQRSAKLPI